MQEKPIIIKSGDIKLEGLIHEVPGPRGVVVCHPHPLYGGNMYNNVVEAIIRAYAKRGDSTLRFNFRGVGKSEGWHDNGIGEEEDLFYNIKYLRNIGKEEIDLAGYSFGAWIIAKTIKNKSYHFYGRIIFVSPPINIIDFSFLRYCPLIKLVLVGQNDEFANAKKLKEISKIWNPDSTFRIINRTDHFYLGREDQIEKIIMEFLEKDEVK